MQFTQQLGLEWCQGGCIVLMKHVFPNAPFKISSKIVLKECHLQLSIARQNFSFGLNVSYTLLVADLLGYPGKKL